MGEKYRNYGKMALFLIICGLAVGILLNAYSRSQRRHGSHSPDSTSAFSKPNGNYTYYFECEYKTATPTSSYEDPEQVAAQKKFNQLLEENKNYLNLGNTPSQGKFGQGSAANPAVAQKPGNAKPMPPRHSTNPHKQEDIEPRVQPYTQEDFVSGRAFGYS